MDSLGIAEACPYALSEYEGNAGSGNAELAEALRGQPRLHPVLVVGPNACGEFLSARDLPARMSACGARMARLPLGPFTAMKELEVRLIEDLLDEMNLRRIPLLIDCIASIDQAPLDPLIEILSTWQNIHVILSFPKVEAGERRLFYLWERFNNFHVELAGYQGLGMIEDVSRRFGGSRIIYGSRYPHFTPMQSMLQVIYSAVEPSVKQEIAGGTLRRVLGEVVS